MPDQGAAVGVIEKCTGVEELSHESGRQLADRNGDVAAHEAGGLAFVDVDQGILAHFVKCQRGMPIRAHGLQIAEKLEHNGFRVP